MGDLDFSKLGGGAGSKSGLGDSSDEEDEDEEMPDLTSDETPAAGEGKGKEPATS